MQNGHASLISALEEFHWPPRAAAELARGAHIVPYDKRSTVFHAGETADLVYILLSGEVKLQFDADDGASLLVSIARSGQMLGVFAPDLAPEHGAKTEQLFTAHALSRCKVAIIPTARTATALQNLPPDQLVRVLERSREQWARLCCRLLSFLTMTVRRRLTHTIGEIADSFGVADARGRLITLRLSHEDLAALVGASRPMVSKHLKELASDGVLTKQQGRYVVLQRKQGAVTEEDGDGSGNGSRGRSTIGLGQSAPHQRAERTLAGTSRGSGASRQNFRVEAKGPVRSI
jgi:CRP/FNR family transcriptional regulator, cyclic AMP receptor protein